jgi:SAM-dependent methyltransferase
MPRATPTSTMHPGCRLSEAPIFRYSSGLVRAGGIRQLARETGLEIDVHEGVGERLPVDDGAAAFVVARQFLRHATNLEGLCREIACVLALGGLLVLARDHVISGADQLQAFLKGHPLHSLYGGENAFQLEEYRIALAGAGLEIEREIGSFYSFIHYAPHTPETLLTEIANRLGPLGGLAKAAIQPAPIIGAAFRALFYIDCRPGRLVSFVCRKG